MAVMRTGDHPELLDTPLRKIFFLALKDTPAEYQRWINIVETKRNFEDDLRYAEFGTVPAHTEGDTPLFEDAIEGGTKRYQPLEHSLGYVITQVMREDDQHGVMVRMTTGLRKSFRNLFEVQAYRVLNSSTTATVARDKGFDGLALLSTAHTMLGPGQANQANKPTTDITLSQTAVEAAVRNFHGIKGEKGLPAFFTPSMAIVDPSDQYTAAKIFRNAKEAGTADNDENWVRKGPDSNGVSSYLVSRYFTATNQWFLLSKKSEHDLNMFIRVHPQFETNVDFATGNFQAKGRARLVTSFGRWFGVYGSKGF
jgi:hypothetical protein